MCAFSLLHVNNKLNCNYCWHQNSYCLWLLAHEKYSKKVH